MPVPRMKSKNSHTKAPLESNIVKNILKYLNSLPGWQAKKLHGNAYSSGWPDLLAVHQGRAVFLEVKRPAPYGTPVTKLQQAELEAWRDAGAVAEVVRSVEDVREIVEGMVHKGEVANQ